MDRAYEPGRVERYPRDLIKSWTTLQDVYCRDQKNNIAKRTLKGCFVSSSRTFYEPDMIFITSESPSRQSLAFFIPRCQLQLQPKPTLVAAILLSGHPLLNPRLAISFIPKRLTRGLATLART